MKIYHTETQADYDALMEKLETEGIETLPKDYWSIFKNETTVIVRTKSEEISERKKGTTYYDLGRICSLYPDIPIIKYKAKADEKMKFTKENIEGLVNKYFDDNVGECPGNLIAEIYAMDDALEKVVVPKFVAEWIEQKKERGTELQTMLRCYRYFYDNVNSYSDEVYFKKAVHWYVDNPYKFIQAYEDGYTIEPEQLYYIPLPHLETSDGIQQVLSKRKGDKNYFASRPNDKLKQRYTKEELEQVPEIYKPYAKPIEEEEE